MVYYHLSSTELQSSLSRSLWCTTTCHLSSSVPPKPITVVYYPLSSTEPQSPLNQSLWCTTPCHLLSLSPLSTNHCGVLPPVIYWASVPPANHCGIISPVIYLSSSHQPIIVVYYCLCHLLIPVPSITMVPFLLSFRCFIIILGKFPNGVLCYLCC